MREKRRYIIYAALFLMMAVSYVDRVNLSVAARPIARDFGLNPVELGFVFSSFLWTYLVCLIPMGWLADRYGAGRVTWIALALWSVAGACTGAAASYTGLLASRWVLGIGESAGYPAGGRLVREWAPRGERGIAAAFLNSGAYAGPAVGSVLVAWLTTSLGWRTSFYATGGLGLTVAIVWAVLYRRPGSASWLGEAERRLILGQRDMDQRDTAEPPRPGAPLRRLLASPTMWALAVTQGCAGYTLYLFMTWLPSYLAATRGLNVFRSGLYSAVPYAAAAVLGIALGWASDRLVRGQPGRPAERRKLISAVLLLSSVILLAPLVRSTWLILLLISVSLACVSTAMAMNIALTNDLLQDGGSAGLAVSLLILGGNSFGILAPIVTGYIVAATSGFTGALLIAGTLLVIGAGVSFTLTRHPIDAAEPSRHAALSPGL